MSPELSHSGRCMHIHHKTRPDELSKYSRLALPDQYDVPLDPTGHYSILK